ncbi:chemotaxis protein CheA [Marinomonas ostreistagni]|uniref:chemotaxis protein CheA n=1 Tax=Marinomonas ostreistagni TaxID=359209 RepID=UPI00194F242B|nr:chemotaxis protein CheA [Marinomonas ostreistagni]MBM6551739.1 chemotaxis protein CheA [Marinomonas ostreistagni]
MDNLNQFNEVFFEEAQEHLETMETLLLAYDIDAPDIEDLNSVFRAAHSIKGGSGIFGFTAMTGLTHVMENMLDAARNQTLRLNSNLITVLLETVDVLKDVLDSYREENEIDWPMVEAAQATLEQAHANVMSTTKPDQETTEPQPNSAQEAQEAQDFGFFDDEPETNQVVSVSQEDDSFGFFDEETASVDTEEGFGFFEDVTETGVEDPSFGLFESETSPPVVDASEKSPQETVKSESAVVKKASKTGAETKTEATSIRVDTLKIDKLVNLVGELVITQSMLNLIGNDVQDSVMEKMQGALAELERNTREIQEAVMSVRMLPISFVFNRFPRLVRDLSVKLDKKIDLVIEGAATEIDKNLVEKISDPLTHLIRNSIDHGIEAPEQRLAKGKNETGTVILSAAQKGGEIVISISDDGAGLNRERILNKALENGISLPEPLTDEAIWQLIFAPGFSTAAEVTDVSGRGVGMDVVKRNIEALGGRVEIFSVPGMGATFQINLPLTLAIVDGMCVEASDQVFVIPLVNIVESIQPTKAQIKIIKNNPILWVREEYWPLVDIAQSLANDQAHSDLEKAIVVLVETAKSRFGLIVDGLVGQQQVVIKSLERHFRRVEGVAGATIMGDGSVALILDVESLTQFIQADIKGGMAHDSSAAIEF